MDIEGKEAVQCLLKDVQTSYDELETDSLGLNFVKRRKLAKRLFHVNQLMWIRNSYSRRQTWLKDSLASLEKLIPTSDNLSRQ